jgi:hypothetical protein
MTERIRDTSPTLPRLIDTGPTLPRLDPAEVAAALGGEPTGVTIPGGLSPITLFAIRQELFKRLQSSGGRPALVDANRRTKIPLSDTQWQKLETLAAQIASPEFSPSAGQVASVLLAYALNSVDRTTTSSPAVSSG